MPDAIFDDPRLAAVYDPLDPDRSDLDVYVALAAELGVGSVLDVGCGTGTFACMLARRGMEVTAVDPARASLDVARTKPDADRVTWLFGDATTVPRLDVDAVFMTANVAQVFVTDDAWLAALHGIRSALRPGGTVVFETRRPERRAWEGWTPDTTRTVVDISGVGEVESWEEVMAVDGPPRPGARLPGPPDGLMAAAVRVVFSRRSGCAARCRGARRPTGAGHVRAAARPHDRAPARAWPRHGPR